MEALTWTMLASLVFVCVSSQPFLWVKRYSPVIEMASYDAKVIRSSEEHVADVFVGPQVIAIKDDLSNDRNVVVLARNWRYTVRSSFSQILGWNGKEPLIRKGNGIFGYAKHSIYRFAARLTRPVYISCQEHSRVEVETASGSLKAYSEDIAHKSSFRIPGKLIHLSTSLQGVTLIEVEDERAKKIYRLTSTSCIQIGKSQTFAGAILTSDGDIVLFDEKATYISRKGNPIKPLARISPDDSVITYDHDRSLLFVIRYFRPHFGEPIECIDVRTGERRLFKDWVSDAYPVGLAADRYYDGE